MTVGGDFIPGDNEFASAPTYPTLFGLRLTPTTNGVLLAVGGWLLAGYLAYTFVKPMFDTSQQLTADIQQKESQLVDQAETQRRIQEARDRLQEEQQLRADVLALFANEESLDTLLLDLNERVLAVNAGITDPERRATLAKFEAVLGSDATQAATADNLVLAQADVVNDGSLGDALNGRLERRIYNVEMQGNFAQTQSIMRNLERLQPLLIVRNFKSELDQSTQVIRIDEQGRVLPTGQPVTRITTGFQLIALLPVETAPAPVAPAAAAPGTPGAPAAAPSP